MAKDSLNKLAKTKTSLGLVEVIPSPPLSKTKSEMVPLRIVTRMQTQVEGVQPLLTPTNTGCTQPSASLEKIKQKRWKNNKCKKINKSDIRKQETFDGSKYLDLGSWESIILEIPNGTRWLYVVQTTVEDTLPQTQTTIEPTRENKGKEPLQKITRAQSKLAEENAAKIRGSQTPQEHTEEPKQKQAKSAIGPTTLSPNHGDNQVSERPVSEERSEEQPPREGEPNLGNKS